MQKIIIPGEAKHILGRDPILRNLLDDPVRFAPSRGSVYADLIESIVYQQISIKAARSIFNRVCGYFGGTVPAAEEMVRTPEDELRALGLSRSKAQYVRNIAAFFIDEGLQNDRLHALPDSEVLALLSRIKGVGEWTVQMILIFSMGREDVFPAHDYGVLSTMVELYGVPDGTRREQTAGIIAIAEKWRPYRTYGTLLIWSWRRRQMGFEDPATVND